MVSNATTISYFVHPTAVVDDGAMVGINTQIWHFSHIRHGAIIGDGCQLGQNSFVDTGAVIGNRVKIQNNVSIYNKVTIEDDVFIGPSVVFTNVINPRSFIDRKHEFKNTLVKQGATIGANATIVCGITIGAYAMIGAGAVITSDVAAHALVMGNPSKQKGWVSEQGYTLVFDAASTAWCEPEKKTYQLINHQIQKI